MEMKSRPCLLAVALLLLAAHAADAACPALTVNFFPAGTTNSPPGWTREAQVAAGNEDTATLNTIKLTAAPPPKLFVQPVHPLFSKKACVPSDCLPAGKGRRRLHQASSSSSSSEPGASGSSSGGLMSLNRLYHNLVSSPQQLQQQQHSDEAGRAADALELGKVTDRDGSGSGSVKRGIAANGGNGGGAEVVSGWTEWKADDEWGWGGHGAAGGSGGRMLEACLTTVTQPASYEVLYNIDGGIAKKATMPKQGAPFIVLDNLDSLAPGKHTLNIKVTMLKSTAEVNSVSSLQPSADQVYSSKVVFNLVEGKGAADAAAEPPAATTPGAKPVAPLPGAAAAAKPGAVAAAPTPAPGAAPAEAPDAVVAAEAPKATPTVKHNGTEITPEPMVDAKVAQQAVKYYCMRQYNVGGKIHSSKTVAAGDEGVNQCAVACNSLGGECAGFGVSGDKCFLMKAFNTNSTAADATLDALCMKSANDWLEFGAANGAGKVGGNFYCLRGYDIKGDPAGTGDMENPVQTAVTEVQGLTPSTCATQCKSTAGCQYMLLKTGVPGAVAGTGTCYLKMHALGGQYGTTGPTKEVDFTCLNGQEAWMTFGGQLDFALPSPEVNTGVMTPALAAVQPAGGIPPAATAAGGAKVYRCIKGYAVNGTALTLTQVSTGDEGLTQCAAKCDENAQAGCIAYSTTDLGACTMFKALNFASMGQSPKTYGMCFGTPDDWNKFGNPDGGGMYCIKNYDFAGDGVRTVDYITITSGAGAVNFCKLQCAAEPQCQFSVTSLGKCYMKQNILSGSFGTTKPDFAVDATCVKGEANWQLAALQVTAAPPTPVGVRGRAGGAGGAGGFNGTRRAIGAKGGRSAAGGLPGGRSWLATLLLGAAVLVLAAL